MNIWFSNNEALIQACLVSAILAYSFQVALRSGVFALSGVGCWMIGGYTTALLAIRGWPMVPAVLVGMVFATIIGLALALLLWRLNDLYLAMATVAFNLLVQTLASAWGFTGGANGLYAIPVLVPTLALLVMCAAVAALAWLRQRGRRGRMLEACRLDSPIASVAGISLRRQRAITFALSSAIGSLSGGLYALLFSTLTPSLGGFDLMVSTLTMLVIGGTLSWYGPIIGAIVVTWLPNLITSFGNWWPAVQGVLVAIMVIYVPGGIAGVLLAGARQTRTLVADRRQRELASNAVGD